MSGSYLMRQWCPELLQEILDQIVPENVIVHQIAKEYAGVATQREVW